MEYQATSEAPYRFSNRTTEFHGNEELGILPDFFSGLGRKTDGALRATR